LNEIKRCKPFFIGLIGNRYGWVPDQSLLENTLEKANQITNQYPDLNYKSVTALEMEYGVLKDQDQISGSIFCFRSIDGEMPDGKTEQYYDEKDPNLKEFQKKKNYEALKKLITRIKEHYKKINNKHNHQIFNYKLKWNNETHKLDIGIEKWGKKIKEAILAELKSQIEENKQDEPTSWLTNEKAAFDQFIESHTRLTKAGINNNEELFTGREATIKDIDNFLDKKLQNNGLILTGESGLGKSAVLAKTYKKLQQNDSDNILILGHSANVSVDASKISTMLKIWIHDLLSSKEIRNPGESQLNSLIEKNELSISNETELKFLVNKFRELLFEISIDKKQIILFIDAIDYFEDSTWANFFTWLPMELPENVKMICTSVDLKRFRHNEYHQQVIIEEKKLDIFTQQEARQLSEKLFLLHHKDLPPSTLNLILNKEDPEKRKGISSPLWINLCINVLLALDEKDFEAIAKKEPTGDKKWVDIYEYIEDIINNEDFPVLPGELFLFLLTKAKKVFDPGLVTGVFGYISTSRFGLRERDMEYLLEEKWSSFKYASLRRWFSRFINIAGEDKKWNLTHRILKNSIIESNTKNETNKELHSDIAKYLFKGTSEDDHLIISETMFHLHKSDKKELSAHFISRFNGDILENATRYICEESSKNKNSRAWFISLLDIDFNSEQVKNGKTLKENDDYYLQLCHKYYTNICHDLLYQGKIDTGEKILSETYSKLSSYTKNDLEKYSLPLGEISQLTGYFAYIKNDFEKAINLYKESISFFSLQPDVRNKIGEIRSLLNISDVHINQQNYQTALGLLEKCKRNINSIKWFISKDEYQLINSQLFERKGSIYFRQNKLNQAGSEYYISLKHLKKLIQDNDLEDITHNNSALIRNIGIAYDNIAKTYLKQIENSSIKEKDLYDNAISNLKTRMNLAERLFRQFPDVLQYKLDIANTFSNFSNLYLMEEKKEKSLEYNLRNIVLLEQLNTFHDQNYIINLARAYTNHTYILTEMNEKSQVQQYCQKCIDLIKNCDITNSPELQALLEYCEKNINN
ncbi:MAG: AAA family ATPase, partial [Bacteroidales bacterium]|nr:AAA family ATPase [Bacteroidales bacterium]